MLVQLTATLSAMSQFLMEAWYITLTKGVDTLIEFSWKASAVLILVLVLIMNFFTIRFTGRFNSTTLPEICA